jgi:hypothetical protein
MDGSVERGGLTAMRLAGPFACIAMVLLSAIAVPRTASGQTDLDGVYVSRGINPDGSEYRGAVQILRDGDRFLVSWISPRAAGEALLLELTSVGVGIRSADTLAVSYVAGPAIGIVVYQIGHDGQLVGRWTTAGDEKVYSETLTKLPDRVPNEPAAPDPPDDPTPPRRRAPSAAGITAL